MALPRCDSCKHRHRVGGACFGAEEKLHNLHVFARACAEVGIELDVAMSEVEDAYDEVGKGPA